MLAAAAAAAAAGGGVEGARRKAARLSLPAKGQDAAERKRVLNVLAQRRYRQRKREHLKKLEANKPAAAASNDLVETGNDLVEAGNDLASTGDGVDVNVDGNVDTIAPAQLENLAYDDMVSADAVAAAVADEDYWKSLLPSLPPSPQPRPLFPPSPASTLAEGLTLALRADQRPPGSSSSSSPLTYSLSGDATHLRVPELDLVRATMTIANRLEIGHLIFSLTSTSPFTLASPAHAFDHLPANLRPTRTQLATRHHPLLDLLPWPRVRDRLCTVFALPVDQRPQVMGTAASAASSPTALLDFVYDLEDTAEGVRFVGAAVDPCSEAAWEVGEQVFANWWWALDRDIIRQSNRLRRARGAKLLGQGSVLAGHL